MKSYSDQITDVFINPIRSVLIVDDRFPTLQSLLSEQLTYNDADKERLTQLLSFCREEPRHWLVDVHDGRGLHELERLPFASLRQCDWLILDYKLDGDEGTGEKAIEVIRQLAANDNFNLIVVYTSQDTNDVFAQIVVALSEKLRSLVYLQKDELEQIERLLDEAEDREPDIRQTLISAVSNNVCISVIRNGPAPQNPANYGAFAAIRGIDIQGELKNLHYHKLIKYLIAQFLASQENQKTFDVDFSEEDSPHRWLLVGNAFVVVVSKEISPTQLLDHLRMALENWKPSPNRLIFAKLRAALEASGLSPERTMFRDRHLQAFWLHKLLETPEAERTHYIGGLLDRQTEVLTDHLRADVTEFTVELVKTALNGQPDTVEITKDFWRIDPKKECNFVKGLVSHNTHVSTKPRHGKNLMPGHVIRFDGGDPLWICLSPACDIEAGRSDSGRDLKKRVQPWIPFTAVQLYKVRPKIALEHANKAWIVFLNVDDKQQQYSFFPDADSTRNPVWEEFFAQYEGRLSDGFGLNIASVARPIEENSVPAFETRSAEIVAQVRSEYATNLTQRLTSHLSRIGLDYLAPELSIQSR